MSFDFQVLKEDYLLAFLLIGGLSYIVILLFFIIVYVFRKS
ncbi:hypothetical protein ACFOZ1_00555 [Gracilibacillus marinus]|uniref:Uncharacterized protein n=1 Tax=Gracilibacillus marinus TaxID=630535 RepID=A0ABV8VPB3_9BACI